MQNDKVLLVSLHRYILAEAGQGCVKVFFTELICLSRTALRNLLFIPIFSKASK